MAARYRSLYKQMNAENAELIAEFKEIHDKYDQDNNKYRDEFNAVGEKFSALADKYIDDLCRTSEGMYSANATKLPNLFKDLIRKDFPNYDDIGVTVE